MTADKKMTVKSLSDEFFKLKEKVLVLEVAIEKSNNDKKDQLKVIKALEQKVEHLQKAAENEVLEPISDDVERIPTNSFECRKCNVNFVNKSEMKKHKKEIHPNKNKCNHCDQNFNLNIDLEVHLKTHEEQKQFKCDTCEQRFFLKWRLRKHKEGHENMLRHCHYFNNALTCPFEENGCMFLHNLSPLCRFAAKCANKLCQFRHSNKTDNGNTSEEEKDNEAVEPNDVNETNGETPNEVNSEELDDDDGSEIEDDDETEIIYQRFLKNHEKKSNENKKKSNDENAAAEMQNFKFVST